MIDVELLKEAVGVAPKEMDAMFWGTFITIDGLPYGQRAMLGHNSDDITNAPAILLLLDAIDKTKQQWIIEKCSEGYVILAKYKSTGKTLTEAVLKAFIEVFK